MKFSALILFLWTIHWNQSSALSYNRPKLCPNAKWSIFGNTFADVSSIGNWPTAMFINQNNTRAVVNRDNGSILIWGNGSYALTSVIDTNLTDGLSIFLKENEEIFVAYRSPNKRVDRWSMVNQTYLSSIAVEEPCDGLFITVNQQLYCSQNTRHQVVSYSLKNYSNESVLIAGTGCAGTLPWMLNSPLGIFVTENMDLYVADCRNDRVQFFTFGETNGITVLGNGSNQNIALQCPTSIALDADGHIFITTQNNHHVIGSNSIGFFCLSLCSGLGLGSTQFKYPFVISFDSLGNLYIIDSGNHRLQKFELISNNTCDETTARTPISTIGANETTWAGNHASTNSPRINVSKIGAFNQPKLSWNASWNSNGNIVTNSSIIGNISNTLFIDEDNTLYLTNFIQQQILIWYRIGFTPTRRINITASPLSLFVTHEDKIFIGNSISNARVHQWSNINQTLLGSTEMYSNCYSLFVSINHDLYCSMGTVHQIVRYSSSSVHLIAGTGCSGFSSLALNLPRGIFVTDTLDLYVADAMNNRIQFFPAGQRNGITVAGNGSIGTISLRFPTSVILDADNYLFIVDSGNRRIVGSNAIGFRCIVGCSTGSGTGSNPFVTPYMLNFDNQGNLYVLDSGSNQVHMFPLNSNQTGKSIIIGRTARFGCGIIQLQLIPDGFNLSSPLRIRRNEEFYINSRVEINCTSSYQLDYQWIIKNASNLVPMDHNQTNTFSDYFIPRRSLSIGLYQLELTVTLNQTLPFQSTRSMFLQILSSGINANLVLLGTSMITSGFGQSLKFNPGLYSIDFDGYSFNASDWTYEYYCRLDGSGGFARHQGVLISIDNHLADPFNASCFSNLSIHVPQWIYNGTSTSPRSALTILSHVLTPNRTYQWMVQISNRFNPTLSATGSVLVRIEQLSSPLIIIGCVITSLCIPNLEYQRINPTTQVSLYSFCSSDCSSLNPTILWNIYQGSLNSSSNTTQWSLLNSMQTYENIWFFGRYTKNFTSTKDLFSSNPQIQFWRFEVIYSSLSVSSRSALDFIVNPSPSNGSCSINPLNGTVWTSFTISCANWTDEDEIKDYSIYFQRLNETERTFIAFASVSIFNVYFPSGVHQVIVSIRDRYDCIAEWYLTQIFVDNDSNGMNNSIDSYLLKGNQNDIGQIIISWSQKFNVDNEQSVLRLISDKNTTASITVSSLFAQSSTFTTGISNISLDEFVWQLNLQAEMREHLINFITALQISSLNTLKLQSTMLAEFTASTNVLTRKTLAIASQRCFDLGKALESMFQRIPVEDVRLIVRQLYQCATNLLTAVNGPLQERMKVLESDVQSANEFPDDYDTDLESIWSNPNLFSDGDDFSISTIEKNRNLYYQKELARQIQQKMNGLIAFLTNALNLHHNLNQSFLINSSSIRMSFEKLPIESFLNRTIVDRQIRFPSNLFNLSNPSQSLRLIVERLAPYGNEKQLISNTNLSRTVSLSLFDTNGTEISIETSRTDPFIITIPRDPAMFLPEMFVQNVTSFSNSSIFNFHYIPLTTSINASIHLEFEPLNRNLSYLLIYRFDDLPIFNTSFTLIDGATLFCSMINQNSSISSTFTYYLDDEQTFGHHSFIFGLRQLNGSEANRHCGNYSNSTFPTTDRRVEFTDNYRLRTYRSSCFYFDENNQWKSDGIRVGPMTNLYQTECFAQHLTQFASGLTFLPEPIQWENVFRFADFNRNPTIYLTVILIILLYILLMIYSRYYDRKDLEKTRSAWPLIDNRRTDPYFYELVVFTGRRSDAGTRSQIYFVLSGENDDTKVRRLSTNSKTHQRNFQSGSIDSFFLSTSKSLGLLNYLHIWHDNTGEELFASWFLKCIVIKDLQTKEIFYFIAQRWFAVEKEDGKIERVLPVANEEEKREFSFLMTKTVRSKFSKDHLWFSIFSDTKSNRLRRVERCTCAFVLLFLSMLLNILYYDRSNINQTDSIQWTLGPLTISMQQVLIGVLIDFFTLIPSFILLQLFRWMRFSRYFSYVFYVFSFSIMATFISLIIARGIEFGDDKCRQWLISTLTGFFSSIFLTQPLRVLCVILLFTLRWFKRNKDQNINEYFTDDVDQIQRRVPNSESKTFVIKRLNAVEIATARTQRLVTIEMFYFIRKFLMSLICFFLIGFFIYSNHNPHSFYQVQHLKRVLINERSQTMNLFQMKTKSDFWQWLQNSLLSNLRAQQWYNGDPPRYLNGYLNEKTNRFIGWAMMKQFRVRSQLCFSTTIESQCENDDYRSFREETRSFYPGWINQTSIISNQSIETAFQFRMKNNETVSQWIDGDHGQYPTAYQGYLYEFRGRLKDLQSNLSALHHYQWIDQYTRAVLIQFYLYNPNVKLFTSVSVLIEFLSTGSLHPQIVIDPIHFHQLASISQWICVVLLIIIVIYFVIEECRLWIQSGKKYLRRFASWLEWSFIVCFITSVVFYLNQYEEVKRIGILFQQTNGYSYIDMKRLTFYHRFFSTFAACTCFLSTLRFLQFGRYHHQLSTFTRTLVRISSEIFAFSFMFSFVFVAFLCLFYLLFITKLSTCSTLLKTVRMLFEMSLLKFDAHELSDAAEFLGPICFTLYIVIVVFICLSMFISIISDHFRATRHESADEHYGEQVFGMIKIRLFKFIKRENDIRPSTTQ